MFAPNLKFSSNIRRLPLGLRFGEVRREISLRQRHPKSILWGRDECFDHIWCIVLHGRRCEVVALARFVDSALGCRIELPVLATPMANTLHRISVVPVVPLEVLAAIVVGPRSLELSPSMFRSQFQFRVLHIRRNYQEDHAASS